MTSRSLALAAIATALTLSGAPTRADDASTALDRLKSLAGEWEDTAVAHGAHAHGSAKPSATRASFRVVSAGSAVMLITGTGTPREMVTVFHGDDGALMATHYCPMQNQPRLRQRPATRPDTIELEFVDGTNMNGHSMHMQRLVLTMLSSDHHRQEWTMVKGGETSTMSFDFVRKQ